MKFDCLEKKHKPEIFFVMVIFMVNLTSCFMADTIRKDITLEEAQSLVAFQICIPSYLPPDVNPTPQIIYDADAANVPEETFIRLMYKRIGNQEVVFEVYQRYTSDTGMKTEDSNLESMNKSAKVIMLYWMTEHVSLSEVKKIIAQMKLEASVFETDQIVWWLYEIIEPSMYRSTMAKWVKDGVEYAIPSYLPADQIEKIALSMFECSIP